MEAREFGEERAAGLSGFDRAHLDAQGSHFGADGVLRDDGQQDHQEDGESGWRGEARDGAGSDQAREEKDDAADYADQVHPPERMTDDSTSLIATREDAESAGRNDEAEKNVAAEPEAEGEELDGAQEGLHDVRQATRGPDARLAGAILLRS